MKRLNGFTLVEILVALFIFTILSLMLMTSLRTVISAQSGTEMKADQLRHLQMAFLKMSRDIEQAVDRPVMQASGKEGLAFIGSPQGFAFTHGGFANPLGTSQHSTLQRTAYEWRDNAILRITWPVLDQSPETKPLVRHLLNSINEAKFEYLDGKGRFHEDWPLSEGNEPLPRGVKIELTLPQGNISQLYLIPVHINKNTAPNIASSANEPKKETQHE